MYNDKKDQFSLPLPEFQLHFDGKLDPKNRWIKLSKLIEWEQLEFKLKYAELFSKDKKGRLAHPFRVALGSLIIKAKLNITDEETVEQIYENPYLQFFLVYEKQLKKKPFNSSSLVHFRKRLSKCGIDNLSEEILTDLIEKKNKSENDNDDKSSGGSSTSEEGKGKTSDNIEATYRENQGEMVIDATVIPADVRYPTDVSLINEGRETAEKILDTLASHSDAPRPRTYRKNARKDFINFIKKRKPNKKKVKKAIKKQLNYLRRVLLHIDRLCKDHSTCLSTKELRRMWIIKEMYRQQREMLQRGISISDRIVSIRMPHVRPIVRGKAGKHTEFGTKISLSTFNGLVSIDRFSWDSFNEGKDLKMQVEKFKERHGHYPEVVLGDNIYGNKDNRKYLSELGIRFGGKPLGRGKKENKKQYLRDVGKRNVVEGRFGIAKRKYGLDRVLEYNVKCAEVSAIMISIAMNLDSCLRSAGKSFWALLKTWNYFTKLEVTARIFLSIHTDIQKAEPVQ